MSLIVSDVSTMSTSIGIASERENLRAVALVINVKMIL
jgi:hypothetical protein